MRVMSATCSWISEASSWLPSRTKNVIEMPCGTDSTRTSHGMASSESWCTRARCSSSVSNGRGALGAVARSSRPSTEPPL
jgi:hypothetical protein